MNRERALIAGALGGLLHFVLVGGLYVYLYGPELFGYSTSTNSFARFDPITLYVVLGAFVLGALPAVLLAERRGPSCRHPESRVVGYTRLISDPRRRDSNGPPAAPGALQSHSEAP